MRKLLVPVASAGCLVLFCGVAHAQGFFLKHSTWYQPVPKNAEAMPDSDAFIKAVAAINPYLSMSAPRLDGDGVLDVATAEMHQGADPDEVLAYLNEAKGLTWKKQVIAGTGSHNLRLVDVGGDGDLDIFGANWSATTQVDLWENLTQRSTPKRGKAK
jgi:hypothetical protein